MDRFRLSAAAPAKINWFLDIRGKRADGYHELSTLMQKISLADVLTLSDTRAEEPVSALPANSASLRLGDLWLELRIFAEERLIPDADNTVARAFRLFTERLAAEGFALRGRTFYADLIKQSPIQGGMGGGSSDGAAMLRLLNAWCRREGMPGLGEEVLRQLAVRIGADVPFCLDPRPLLYCTGIGEVLSETRRVEKSLPLIILLPGTKVSTPEAFRAYGIHREACELLRPSSPEAFSRCLAEGRYEELRDWGQNTFSFLHEKNGARIKELEALLTDSGAVYAAMSGSGPSMFGLYRTTEERDRALAALRQQAKGRMHFLPAETLASELSPPETVNL